MSLFSRLIRNSLWLLTARFGAQVCAVIVTYLLARRLGIEGFGEYSFIAAAIVIGNTLTTFGSDMYLIREIAVKSESSQLSSALILQLVLSCLFIILVFFLASYLPNQTSESILALQVYSLALIPLSFFTVFTSALRGQQKMNSYAWLNLAITILQIIAVALFIPRGASVVALACLLLALQVTGSILAGTLCAIFIPNFWRGWRLSLNETIHLFIACIPVAALAILGVLYQKLSLTMLSFLGGASMVGWFSAAARAVEAARIGHIAAFTALYPAMANAKINKDSVRTFRLSWFLLLIVASMGTILLFLFAKPLIHIFFGAEYQLSIPVLRILSFTLVPYSVNTFLSLALLAAKREKVVVRILFISLFALTVLNLWLIPRAGEVGAGWAFLIAEVMQSGLFLFEWKTNRARMNQVLIHHQGVSYELPDLS